MQIRTSVLACLSLAPLLIGATTDSKAPTLKELASATFTGLTETPVTLTDGSWRGKPFTPGGSSAPTAGLVEGFRHFVPDWYRLENAAILVFEPVEVLA